MSKQAVKKQNIEIGMDFTTGPLLPLLIRFLLPFLLANLLNSLYNTVDTAIIEQIYGQYRYRSLQLGRQNAEPVYEYIRRTGRRGRFWSHK